MNRQGEGGGGGLGGTVACANGRATQKQKRIDRRSANSVRIVRIELLTGRWKRSETGK